MKLVKITPKDMDIYMGGLQEFFLPWYLKKSKIYIRLKASLSLWRKEVTLLKKGW